MTNDEVASPRTQRRRLGGWLPREEAQLAHYRTMLVAKARERARTAPRTRAVIVIECDDPAVGQVACVFVGMADVSSCRIEALPGQRVRKGDELGFFQYGGSTCCLVFEPGVIDRFVVEPPFGDRQPPIEVNAAVARVASRNASSSQSNG
ncbi:hypothetical protein OKW30_000681 [Paraburkholderia sp. Clong3]